MSDDKMFKKWLGWSSCQVMWLAGGGFVWPDDQTQPNRIHCWYYHWYSYYDSNDNYNISYDDNGLLEESFTFQTFKEWGKQVRVCMPTNWLLDDWALVESYMCETNQYNKTTFSWHQWQKALPLDFVLVIILVSVSS